MWQSIFLCRSIDGKNVMITLRCITKFKKYNNVYNVSILLIILCMSMYYCLNVNYIVVNPFYAIHFLLIKIIKVSNRLKEVFKLTNTYVINTCNC